MKGIAHDKNFITHYLYIDGYLCSQKAKYISLANTLRMDVPTEIYGAGQKLILHPINI